MALRQRRSVVGGGLLVAHDSPVAEGRFDLTSGPVIPVAFMENMIVHERHRRGAAHLHDSALCAPAIPGAGSEADAHATLKLSHLLGSPFRSPAVVGVDPGGLDTTSGGNGCGQFGSLLGVGANPPREPREHQYEPALRAPT